MATITQDLYASAPQPLPFAPAFHYRAFVLPRPAGNLLVYSSPAVADEAGTVEGLGGVAVQYLNHRHEAAFGVEAVAAAFDSRLAVHEDDRAAVEEYHAVDEPFSGRTL